MGFFVKYKLHFNAVLLFFWGWLLVSRLIAKDTNLVQILLPIIFIGLSIYNIYTVVNNSKKN